MLIINSVLSSSIIFPSYFILKKYISQQRALLGSLLISVIPVVALFSFFLLSENLFIPLTMFSIWFLLEAFENNKMRWDFLAALSVFYLYFTREIGLVFIIAVCAALAFFILSSERKERLQVVKDKAILICALAIPLLLWISYKIFIISQVSFYGTEELMNTLITVFSTPSQFEHFSILMLHEIDYLVLSSYVMVFIFSIVFIIACLFRPKLSGFDKFLQQSGQKKLLAFRSVIIYCLVFSAGMLVITVTFMEAWGERAIYGRYIDPIVPVIFLFGIIGIGVLFTKYTDVKWKSESLFCLGIAILFIAVYTLPGEVLDAFPNDFGLYYIMYLENCFQNSFAMVLLLAAVFVIIPYILMKYNHKNNFLIRVSVFLIILSVIFSMPIYETQNKNMRNMESINEIGRYLQKHSSADTKILMDSDYLQDTQILIYSDYINRGWYPQLTQFWTKGYIIEQSSAEDPSGVVTKEFVDKTDYIISKKILPYPCVVASINTYKLYTPHAPAEYVQNLSLPFVIETESNVSSCLIDGFYYPEGTFRWTGELSAVKIEYPKKSGPFLLQVKTGGGRPENNPANVTFSLNGHLIGVMNKTSGTEIFSAVIPEYYLETNYQVLGIKTNTWKPSDYGSTDSRDLGITVDWIRGSDISFDEMYDVEFWNSVPTRWMTENATLLIHSDENRVANLMFRASSFYKPRTLEIYTNEGLQKTQRIIPSGFANVSAQFPLQKGENSIRLQVPEGCDRPIDVSELNNSDRRCLSIAVQNVTFS